MALGFPLYAPLSLDGVDNAFLALQPRTLTLWGVYAISRQP